ncbi:MAG: type I DNA topoisomerase [Alphaproteobacteria bacterium]
MWFATDPDREGEAISWHLKEILAKRRMLNKRTHHRVAFNEITKTAVQAAMSAPREIDDALVQAYLARRALDYLVGFNLSPVLWRKLPGSRSAGRVQSVALRLICEREAEIEVFKPQEYWSIEATFKTGAGEVFTARLTHFDGDKLDKMTIKTEADAKAMVEKLMSLDFSVAAMTEKKARRNPYAPFITSTLQMEAARKLGFGASQTMRVAQKLYEAGHITYMRTDGTNLSGEAIAGARKMIGKEYGDEYLPKSPRVYKSKAKNAQEAHEAIRPSDMGKAPRMLVSKLEPEQAKLYELIWRRTMACQMEAAVFNQATVDLSDSSGAFTFRATGSILVFDGFLRVYAAEKNDNQANEQDRRLPALSQGDAVHREKVDPNQHFTQPPPRYSEASLVKRMEELGIGRPSTYASILQVLQDRNYVSLDKKRFHAEDRGRIVTAFLEHFFARYVEYDFTASLEDKLDEISGGRAGWKDVLGDFWVEFSAAVAATKELRITEVIDVLNEVLAPHFFPETEEMPKPRECPACKEGELGLKLGRTGGFIGCSRYPDCNYTRALAVVDGEDATADLANGPKELGLDPETGLPVTLRKGPYGVYVQLGPQPDAPKPPKGEKAEKPKRTSLMKFMQPDDVDLELALKLLELPREVGLHPEDQKPITAAIGRFGPYLLHDGVYANLSKDDDTVLTIGLNHALTLIEDKKKKGGRRGGAAKGTELGKHPSDDKPITKHEGRYGPYVKHGRTNATITKDYDPETLTLEQAIELIDAKKSKGGAKKKAATKKKAPAKKKTAAKKTTAKKPATKKSAAKKSTGKSKKSA